LPREKLWVNFIANIQELAEHLGFEIDLAAHWPATQSGCPTACVICDAPENDGEFAGFETADRNKQLRTKALGQASEHPYIWCLSEEAEARWDSRQGEEIGAALRALFCEGLISDLA
jgi:hypothetical protein